MKNTEFCDRCEGRVSSVETSVLCGECLYALTDQIKNSVAALLAARDFARGIRDGWDCDSDAHRHNTSCRCCDAAKLFVVLDSAILATSLGENK